MTNYHWEDFEKWLGSDALSVLLGDSTRDAGTINRYVKEVAEFLTALISETKFSNQYGVWEFDNQEWVEKNGWKNVQAKGKQWIAHTRRERERERESRKNDQLEVLRDRRDRESKIICQTN